MITLSTIVWEKNFESVLDPQNWFMTYKHPKVIKCLVVNNVTSKDKLAEKLKGKDLEVLYVEDFKEEAKRFFQLRIDESTEGYYYTIPYFVLLLRARTPYIFNVSPDCIVSFQSDFISDSIEELKKDKVLTTTLEWKEGVGKLEAVRESDNFYYSRVFSDQVFMADVGKLRKVDYNTEFGGDFSPLYGGNSFERRLTCYMNNTRTFRAIYKKYNYQHIC